LYNAYGGMLFSYILQFIPERAEAGELLVTIFSRCAPRLANASSEHLWIFREMFIYGQDKEGVASRAGKDQAYVSRLLRECLLLIRKNLG
jgi:hypothetical protein